MTSAGFVFECFTMCARYSRLIRRGRTIKIIRLRSSISLQHKDSRRSGSLCVAENALAVDLKAPATAGRPVARRTLLEGSGTPGGGAKGLTTLVYTRIEE